MMDKRSAKKKPNVTDRLQRVALEHEQIAKQLEGNIHSLENSLHQAEAKVDDLHKISKKRYAPKSKRLK